MCILYSVTIMQPNGQLPDLSLGGSYSAMNVANNVTQSVNKSLECSCTFNFTVAHRKENDDFLLRYTSVIDC